MEVRGCLPEDKEVQRGKDTRKKLIESPCKELSAYELLSICYNTKVAQKREMQEQKREKLDLLLPFASITMPERRTASIITDRQQQQQQLLF